MSLTICTVVYNEERNLSVIEQNIHLLKEKAPDIHFLLIDNASNDGSTNSLHDLSQKYAVRYILRNKNHLPQARQQALTSSSTQWVGFIDADCRIDETWISQLRTNLFVEPQIAGFGGPWRIYGAASEIYQALFSTFFGNFGHSYLSTHGQQKLVVHLPTANIVYDREKALQVGGFSSSHPRVGEDLDLSHRISQSGLKLRFDPFLKIQHELPPSLWAWCCKMFLYGTARGEIFMRYKTIKSYTSLLPILFFPFFLFLGFVSSVWFLAALCGYLLVCLVYSAKSGLRICLLVVVRMIATHVFYAAGVYYGCYRQLKAALKKKLFQSPHKFPA